MTPTMPEAAVDGRGPLRAAPLVAVPARLREDAAGHEHARPRVEPARDGLAEAVVGAAGIAHGREALHERLLHAPERLGHEEARRVLPVLLGGVAVRGVDVDVGVGEARHEGAPAEVERLDRGRAAAPPGPTR